MDHLITTPCGVLRGTDGRVPGTAAYKGIRYATAGRWEYPTQVTSWEGVYDATEYGSCCYQLRAFFNEADHPQTNFYYREFREGEQYSYSEDCLFLNIYTPDDAKEGDNLPVLFYIHGGGFTGGCGHEKHFDGPVWPAKGVIGVTVNYRLGPLGFLTLPELKQESGVTGNYGLYDQLEALRWVRANISAFGGDKNNITIMGQSAGAMSVQQLCLSPLTQGLFHKAVMSSGGGVSKMMQAAVPEKGYDFWHAVMKAAGCENLSQFRQLPVEKLFSVWQNLKKSVKGGQCAPCLDGRLVVGTGTELLKAGKQRHIPYMAGTTTEDVMPPILYSMSESWCRAQKKSSYLWLFDRKLPGDHKGAWHSSDLWYWFGTLDNCWRPMTARDRALSDSMTDYLTNFCKYGDPNGAGLTAWLPMGRGQQKHLRLGEGDIRMDRADMLKLTKTMLTSKATGE